MPETTKDFRLTLVVESKTCRACQEKFTCTGVEANLCAACYNKYSKINPDEAKILTLLSHLWQSKA